MQHLVVLGATGSVGRNTLDVARRHPDKLSVLALSAERNADALFELCQEFRPRYAVLGTADAAARLAPQLAAAGIACDVRHGMAALCEIAGLPEAQQVMVAVVGAAGLLPTLAAIDAGKRVLIANKEPLVMAGALVMARARTSRATLIPIDSEHNAVFQCLSAGDGTVARVRRIVLTASGGPFRETPLAALAGVTVAQAIKHPNWVMGPKISVDSATMMNKGLELIEAHHWFGLAPERIDVVMHPESVVHSMVEFIDGSTLAQLGQPDMRVPIAHALAWPERWVSGVEGLDLTSVGRLRFESVDLRRFPCLRIAREALQGGGVLPNVLNAANEIAVAAFLAGRIGFTGVAELIARALDAAAAAQLPGGSTVDEVLVVDRWARERATRLVEEASARVSNV